MTAKTTMPPKIKAFFDEALPSGQGGHVLAVGEEHDQTQHLTFLRAQLPTLISEHNLGTIGFERAAYMNVFLWAYQDGTLDKMLGSHEAAKAYFCDVMRESTTEDLAENSTLSSHILLDAMDASIKPVFFDARDPLVEERSDLAEATHALRQAKEKYQRSHKIEPETLNAQLRIDAGLRKQLFMQAGMIESDALSLSDLKRRARSYEMTIPELKKEAFPSRASLAWVLDEMDALCARNPYYLKRLESMEQLIVCGRDVAHPMGSDALSATLLDAMVTPKKNSITVSGFFHVNGVGAEENDSNQYIHGTLSEHLAALEDKQKPALRVHSAIVAGLGWEKEMKVFAKVFDHGAKTKITPMRLFNVALDMVAPLPQLDTQPLIKKVMRGLPKELPAAARTKELAAQRVNPLLVPEIARAAEAVRLDWNPELKTQRQR